MEDVVVEKPIEEIENLGAPATEAEARAALDAVTTGAEAVGIVVTEENTKFLTIESSPEWRGTLIEEETEMVEEREDAETSNIPSTSTVGLETLVPRRKRRRSREETQPSRPARRRRTRSVTVAEVA